MEELKRQAEEYRILYNQGKVTREEAKEKIVPYIDAFNEKSSEIAKKHSMKPKKISFGQYIR